MPSVGGIAPPPGISPGIPLPPFAPPARPAIHTPPPKPTAAAQTIKVEVGEEVEQERRKASKKTALYAALAAIVGIGVGFAAGGAKERGDRGKLAVEGAAGLEKDVRAANEKMQELNEKLGAATEQLSRKNFPTQLTTDLGAINIPFDATNLEGKQIGSLPGRVMRQLLGFTTSVQDLNKTKDSLKNLLAAAQGPVEKSWKEQEEPLANFSVVFRRDGDKTLAELVPNKAPFPFGKDWPAKYTVSRLERTQQGVKPADKEATRWTKGDIAGGDLQALPVDPQSVAAFTSEQIVFKLRSALIDVRQLLEGKKDDPTSETPGLIKEGDDLANELHKISLAR
ncbi:formin [Sorangium sp. So ce1151]|uniref:formin n=1 Tax=Sorangium sp. So ce1151 TaxID=3133332 RepID=UPI003F601371